MTVLAYLVAATITATLRIERLRQDFSRQVADQRDAIVST